MALVSNMEYSERRPDKVLEFLVACFVVSTAVIEDLWSSAATEGLVNVFSHVFDRVLSDCFVREDIVVG